jgi:hypothetical protein
MDDGLEEWWERKGKSTGCVEWTEPMTYLRSFDDMEGAKNISIKLNPNVLTRCAVINMIITF